MGESLHSQVMGDSGATLSDLCASRPHHELLGPYLVRRLLENVPTAPL